MNYKGFIDMLNINSTSSCEREFALYLAQHLATPKCSVEMMEVGDGTLNLLFSWGEPQLVFCTHIDTVPPYIAPSEQGDTFMGRGTCDAKGQIWSLHQACLELERMGRTGFALLLLSGEETGSFGAKHFAKTHSGAPYLLVGEPTDNCMVAAAKGTKAFQIEISGRSAHSGYPHMGASAINMFVDFVNHLRAINFPADDVLGETTWNIGKLASDNPQNILSPEVSFRLYFRTTFASDAMVTELMSNLSNGGNEPWRQHISVKALGGDTPTRFLSVEGLPTTTVAFGSDAPHLNVFEHKMLCGPGSILTAHTANECVTKQELEQATRQYVHIFNQLVKQ
ncbi:MAG: M20/M25/M40 family metallo-hydrolase [Muribaculaceae bacterium]